METRNHTCNLRFDSKPSKLIFSIYLLVIKGTIISERPLKIMLHTERLDELLEGTVDWRADVGDILPEIDSGNRTLGDTLWGELKLLQWLLAHISPYIESAGDHTL